MKANKIFTFMKGNHVKKVKQTDMLVMSAFFLVLLSVKHEISNLYASKDVFANASTRQEKSKESFKTTQTKPSFLRLMVGF